MLAKDLRIHPKAQRAIVPSSLRKIVDDLDLDAIGTLHGVEYTINGKNAVWIVDGQHRLQSLLHHGLGEWETTVQVHHSVKDDAAASALFLRLNRRAPVSSFDTYQNELRAGHPVAVGVHEIVSAHGLKVDSYVHDGAVTCVGALKKLYAKDDGVSLNRTLSVVLDAWGPVASSVEGKLMEGLGAVIAKYAGEIDQAALVKKLAKYPGGASGVQGNAKGLRNVRGASLANCVAEIIIGAYNKGRRSGQLGDV